MVKCASLCVHSFPLILVCQFFALYFFLSCVCYKSLIISLMKAASIDGQPASMCDFFIDEQINDDDVIL